MGVHTWFPKTIVLFNDLLVLNGRGEGKGLHLVHSSSRRRDIGMTNAWY